MSNATEHIGWKDQPDGRGTFDLLKTCIATIFLTCWTSVCPNVPACGTGRFGILKGRLQLFILAMMGPDFVMTIAIGQLYRAVTDRNEFRNKGYAPDWTLKKSFFVNMGGLHIILPEPDDAGLQTIPVSCRQLKYLVDRGFLKMPNLQTQEIDGRNKLDGLGRSLAALQALWFAFNVFGRAIEGLHITTLELTTLAFIFLMVISSFAWWHKPMDVSQPIFVRCHTSLSEIIQTASKHDGLHGTEYGRTPLSFLDREEWFLSQIWQSYVNILRRIFRVKRQQRTKYSFPSLDFPDMNIKWEFFVGIFIGTYSGLFMIAWHSYFPTSTEKLLWRVSSTICLVYGIIGSIIALFSHDQTLLYSWMQKTFPCFGFKSTFCPTPPAQQRSSILHNLRNLSLDQDPQWAMSLRIWIPSTILCIVYAFARVYILFEDFYSLRRQPVSTYDSVEWARYSPVF